MCTNKKHGKIKSCWARFLSWRVRVRECQREGRNNDTHMQEPLETHECKNC